MDEGLARPQQLRRLVGTALWREELCKPCGRSPHGPSQWPEPFVVQAHASQAPALKQCGIPKGIAFPPPATDTSGPRCMQQWLFDIACRQGGAQKTHLGSMQSSRQALSSLRWAAAAKARVKTWAHGWRAALGTFRMVAVLAARMAERDGSCKPSVSIGMAASTAAARTSGRQVG